MCAQAQTRRGIVWDDRQSVTEPGVPNTETCAYAEFVVLGENCALLVYSKFNYSNADGVPVKIILARRIFAEWVC